MTQGRCSDPKKERARRRKIGEYNRRRVFTASTRRKIAARRMGPRNPEWKGSRVGYRGLHKWVDAHIDRKPYGICPRCHRWAKLESHFRGTKYTRESAGWVDLCHTCHQEITRATVPFH
jgi:hypothetical protein